MNKFLKILLGIVIVVAVIIIGAIVYINTALPDVGPPPDVKAISTPETVARGEYLAKHVALCVDCHTGRQFDKFTAPLVDAPIGKGGEVFPEEAGFPGTFIASNITPANLGDWTDGEIFRVITTGERKNGEPVFPIMPYQSYQYMDKNDVLAIIAYLRTLKPVENKLPESKPSFPFSLILRTIPKPAEFHDAPPRSDSVSYGRYLTTIAACGDCHTPPDKPDLQFSGGVEFMMPTGGIVRTANITPDVETGIGSWTKDMFIQRFKYYLNEKTWLQVKPNQFNTIMPWSMYAGMTDEDLGDIYNYLRTIKPVKNSMERFTAK